MNTLSPPKNRLFEIFDQVLRTWAFLPAEPAPMASSSLELPLSFAVAISAPKQALLLVRGEAPFGKLLAESVTGEAQTEAEGADAFKELVNLFCGHLSTDFWSTQTSRFEAFMPRASSAMGLASQNPDACCGAKVENHYVEIRLFSRSQP